MPGFHVENFGCRATQADGAALERQFLERGLAPAASHDADIVVINSCTVTAAADQDARAAIRRIQRLNPKAKILVTGCYAQRAPEEVAALPGVSWVVGNSHKHKAAELATAGFVPLKQLTAPSLTDSILVGDIFAHTELLAAPVFGAGEERTRPNLKVQDGCDNRCSFCVIPYVRGQSRSLKLEAVLAEVRELAALGYRELVISGINLGRWGRDLVPALRFEDLVSAILRHTPLEKLRISSVEPMDWSDHLIELVANSPRVAKHAHVPMQSGSDAVLRRMHRKYRPWHYREKIRKIRDAMPTAAIGADVMAGFPGETDAEFEETRRMVEELPFTYLHVFTYSARPGTPAAQMKPVPAQMARERNRILRELAAAKKQAFMQSFVGRTIEAITLQSSLEPCGPDTLARPAPASGKDGRGSSGTFTEALTDNYLRLRLPGQHEPNQWITARVSDIVQGVMVGTLSDGPGQSDGRS